MNTKLLAIFMVTVGLIAVSPAHAEVVGAHVSKIFPDHTESGFASAAILVCAGNTSLSYPEIIVSSDKETKSVILQRDVPENTCLGETVRIQANDLSSITATLQSSTGPIAIDVLTRDSDGVLMMKGISVDGKITVETSSTIPVSGKTSVIKVEFFDTFKNAVQHVNYDIKVTQDGIVVLDEMQSHSHVGVKYHETESLKSDSPLNIQITLLGIGLPGEESSWIGPKGDTVSFMAVPEFGAVALLVLIGTISTVVLLSYKNQISLSQ